MWNSAKVTSGILLAGCLIFLTALPAYADVCVWRDPERTMQKIFPTAQDYKTLTFTMTPEKIAAIEAKLGAPLEDSEKKEFNLYDITGGAGVIGTVVALAGKGEYGTIEVTIGIDPHDKIAGAYIQRSRERGTQALQSKTFLDQFTGKTANDALMVGKDIQPASLETQAALEVVAFAIHKMLIFNHILKTGDTP